MYLMEIFKLLKETHKLLKYYIFVYIHYFIQLYCWKSTEYDSQSRFLPWGKKKTTALDEVPIQCRTVSHLFGLCPPN